MDEFEMIETYFAPLTMGQAGSAGLKDDAAVISVPDGYELVVTSDTVNEGIHFLIGESPANIARKALRSNLSDLAAMGAKPLCYQLNIAFPEQPTGAWLSGFCKSLHGDNEKYGIYCSGGDTTSIQSSGVSISITAMGIVPKGRAVRRGGAKAGDHIVITGPVGDAVLGLKALQEGLSEDLYQNAINRYRVPQPRTGLVATLQGHVNAAADISDGLIADCLHIARASNLGLEIDINAITFSKDVQAAIEESDISHEKAIQSGDDYELILAVSPTELDFVIDELKNNNLNPLVIGEFKGDTLELSILNSKSLRIHDLNQGWKHF